MNYTILEWNANQANWQSIANTASTAFSVGGKAPGTQLVFKVIGNNSVGSSNPSEAIYL